MPHDTTPDSFRNLKFPLDWNKIFDYIGGFPAYMKPYAGGGWKNVYKLESKEHRRSFVATTALPECCLT